MEQSLPSVGAGPLGTATKQRPSFRRVSGAPSEVERGEPRANQATGSPEREERKPGTHGASERLGTRGADTLHRPFPVFCKVAAKLGRERLGECHRRKRTRLRRANSSRLSAQKAWRSLSAWAPVKRAADQRPSSRSAERVVARNSGSAEGKSGRVGRIAAGRLTARSGARPAFAG